MAQAHASEHRNPDIYYVPPQSKWPFWASLALFTTMVGWGSHPALASSCLLFGAALVGQGCLQFALRRERKAV